MAENIESAENTENAEKKYKVGGLSLPLQEWIYADNQAQAILGIASTLRARLGTESKDMRLLDSRYDLPGAHTYEEFFRLAEEVAYTLREAHWEANQKALAGEDT